MDHRAKDIDKAFYVQLGYRLELLRKLHGVKLYKLSELLGVTYQQYQKYESGRSRLPLDRMVILKKFYDVSYEMLLEGGK